MTTGYSKSEGKVVDMSSARRGREAPERVTDVDNGYELQACVAQAKAFGARLREAKEAHQRAMEREHAARRLVEQTQRELDDSVVKIDSLSAQTAELVRLRSAVRSSRVAWRGQLVGIRQTLDEVAAYNGVIRPKLVALLGIGWLGALSSAPELNAFGAAVLAEPMHARGRRDAHELRNFAKEKRGLDAAFGGLAWLDRELIGAADALAVHEREEGDFVRVAGGFPNPELGEDRELLRHTG